MMVPTERTLKIKKDVLIKFAFIESISRNSS